MPGIARPDDVRRQNQWNILMALRRHGPLSRTEISAITRLSASTVTVITNGLMERAMVIAEAITDPLQSRRGRPQVRLCLNPKAASVALIVVTLNRLYCMIADYSAKTIVKTMDLSRTKGVSGQAIAEAAVGSLHDLLAKGDSKKGPLKSILVSVEGIVDASGSTLLWSPFIDDDDVPLKAALEQAFGVSTELCNDCTLIVEALRWAAPDQYGTDFAAVLLANGIGMGLYLHDRPFSGIRSSAAEFGHMTYQPMGSLCRCGRRGCIEAYAGSYAIWRRATGGQCEEISVLEPPENGMAMITARARQSDGIERLAFREAGLAIGTGLANLFVMIDPFPVALVGPGVEAIDLMRDAILEALKGASFGQPFREDMLDDFSDQVGLISNGGMMRSLVSLDAVLSERIEPGFQPAKKPANKRQ